LANSACPISLLNRDYNSAEKYTATLITLANEHALEVCRNWGECFRGILLSRKGKIVEGLDIFRAAFERLAKKNPQQYYIWLMASLAAATNRAGDEARGLAIIDEALARAERNEELSQIAELFRIKAGLTLRAQKPDAAKEAEQLLHRSLGVAREQGALSWELRTATSLSRLLSREDRAAEARRLLGPIYARFTEGFETHDLKAARTTLSLLG
jgi:predicted ATPase